VPGAVAAKLKEHWLETAEQVLAVAACREGREGLERLLGFDAAQLQDFLGQLSAVVDPAVRERLGQPAALRTLGLQLTEEQKRQAGLE